eukprot:comp12451_c0_seq1/m.7380 comp12451_c0_seq1/g.7380  ORF comp12451_c0_seq1/g.7380 comp12451_c0_seq1/m.7380 type:complete len:193 (-) comp12451_c0_seq1:123-701(-)
MAEELGNVVNRKGERVDPATLSANEVIGVFFGAKNCPESATFLPKLQAVYRDVNKGSKRFEVVLCGWDMKEENYKSYTFENQSWPSIAWADGATRDALKKEHKVKATPTLVLLKPDGSVISTQGVDVVLQDSKGAHFPWTSFKVVAKAETLNLQTFTQKFIRSFPYRLMQIALIVLIIKVVRLFTGSEFLPI